MLALVAPAEPVQITVDTSAPLCTNFLGFGVQWSPYPWFDITRRRLAENVRTAGFHARAHRPADDALLYLLRRFGRGRAIPFTTGTTIA